LLKIDWCPKFGVVYLPPHKVLVLSGSCLTFIVYKKRQSLGIDFRSIQRRLRRAELAKTELAKIELQTGGFVRDDQPRQNYEHSGRCALLSKLNTAEKACSWQG
jgi:hypothetical protein